MLKIQWQNFSLLFRNASEKGGLLLIACFLAIGMANTSTTEAGYLKLLNREIYFWGLETTLLTFTNKFLMAIFFLLVGLEIKREMIAGNLATAKQRLLPIAAAVGGVLLPVIIYTAFNSDDTLKIRGWAVPAATDIAFSLGVLALFGKKLPISLRVFLTALAIIDDLMAVIIIALFYSNGLSGYYLSMATVIIFLLLSVNLTNFNQLWLYIALGFALWYAFYMSGISPTVAGVVLGMCIPYKINGSNKSLLKELESNLSSVVQYFILPLFAFANSGLIITYSDFATLTDSMVIGIIASLFFGKQLGIFITSFVIVKKGWAVLPANSNWLQFYGIAILCGIGFTMSLFVGDLAFDGLNSLHNKMKLGVLAGSLCSAVAGMFYLWIIPKGRNA